MNQIQIRRLRKALGDGTDSHVVIELFDEMGLHIRHETTDDFREKRRGSASVNSFVLRDDDGRDIHWETYREGERDINDALAHMLASAWGELQRRRAVPWARAMVSAVGSALLAVIKSKG